MKNRILFSVLFMFAAAVNRVNPQANTNQAPAPNVYELSGGQLHVTFTTTSKNGQPYFSYQDGTQTLKFKGKEIDQEKSAIGTLVTVTIHMIPDAGSTAFTLLVPPVRLAQSSSYPIHTLGITTMHRSAISPALIVGQVQTYTTTELSGTAKMVVF